ncbi:MAG: carboxymuconolactone decarboxylase family protein [Gammaproteobacteria bacterium]|nr:carboxymuconolactone decarboxylase family protein [Gammaproteobacteria bacterium]
MTPPRMPPIPLECLTASQRAVYDRIASGPRRQIGAPHWAWLRSPVLADKAQELGRFCRFETTVEPRLIEIAILTTAAHWQAALEWDLHESEALRMGLDATTIEAIRQQNGPRFETPAEQAVYRFTLQLWHERRTSADNYAGLVHAIGEQGAVELVGILGYYALISMTIVAFEVASHIREGDVFADLREAR